MTTQVFRGRNLLDARMVAMQALGSNAVVVTTRTIRRPGVMGFFGATDVEIAAAVEPVPETPSSRAKGPFAQGAYAGAGLPPLAGTDSPAVLRAELRNEMRTMKTLLGRPAAAPPEDLAAELAAMREAIEQLAPTSRKGDAIASLLRTSGIEGAAATAIAQLMRVKKDPPTEIGERFREAAAELVHVTAWPLLSTGRVVIVAVGSTGVGKTTTIAKLAAKAKADGKSVTLVSCDTFRVGATEQIARYAELLGSRFEVARDASELATVLGRVRTDVVLVDTSGRPPTANAPERLLAAGSFRTDAACQGYLRHVLLCMPASIRAVDAARLAKAFSMANPTAIAVTKLDETDVPSGIVHAAFFAKLPISVVCMGQRVPEDIAPATVGGLLDALTRKRDARRAAA
jgi:flagellar biosynthesis protein FlhF